MMRGGGAGGGVGCVVGERACSVPGEEERKEGKEGGCKEGNEEGCEGVEMWTPLQVEPLHSGHQLGTNILSLIARCP